MTRTKPILRWAGGKRWLVKQIGGFLPERIGNYYEPFAGGLSILIHLLDHELINGESFVSDTNSNLINFYNELINNPNRLIRELKKYRNSEDEYYLERARNRTVNHTKAAKFLYLNRTSFNGIYRENLKGEYNVPYGHKIYKNLFDTDHILQVSNTLRDTVFQSMDFEQIEEQLNEGDLVFLDPPYTVAHQHNGFVKYNQKIFSWEDQIRLKDFILRIDAQGIFFILTNAMHDSIQNLYDGIGTMHQLSRSSQVGGKGAKRASYSELLITNTI